MKRSSASTSVRRCSSAFCSSAVSGCAEGARLDLLAQPHALAVGGDVLDLVGDRAAVGLAQVRQRVGERRRPARTCAGSCAGICAISSGVSPSGSGSSAGSPLGLGAERVEPRRQVAVRAVGLEQRRRGLHGLQQLLVDGAAAAAPARGAAARPRPRRRRGGCGAGPSATPRSRRRPRRSRARPAGSSSTTCEEAPRLRALDDAVVVGRGHGHDLLGADHARRSSPSPTG